LSGPEWTPQEVRPDRCRGAVAVLGRIFSEENRALPCWEKEPRTSDWIADWLVTHLGKLLELAPSDADASFDNRLGEATQAVAAMLASCQTMPLRPTPTSLGAYHDPDRSSKFRGKPGDFMSRRDSRFPRRIGFCKLATEFLAEIRSARICWIDI
jgi:hypothetical protein